jgi:DNA (cytosine-5)-methyltransferase 1
MKLNNNLKLVEFCAGTGAFSLAFKSINVDVVYANDFDKNSEKIFNENNKGLKLDCRDINIIKVEDIPKHDILTAGFPCQPFSIAGNKLGFDDERSNVFWKLIKIIKYHKPKIVIFENVKNLKTHDNGNTFKVIEKEINKLKYYYKYKILNTCDITNIPQNRERIYIVCFKNKEDCDKFEFPTSENNESNPKRLQLKDILEKEVNDKYYYKDTLKVFNEIDNNVVKDISTNTIYQYRRYYVRENKNGLCPTLTANMGSGGHNVPLLRNNKGVRKLTPKECFILQGFPNNYKLPKLSDSALYKLAGNAVSVPVVLKIAKNIEKIYKNNNIINV